MPAKSIENRLKEAVTCLGDLEDVLKRREMELSAIYQTESIIASTLDIETLLTMINKLIMQVIRCDRASVLLLDENHGDLLVTGSLEQADDSAFESMRLTERGEVTANVLKSRQPLIITRRDVAEGLFTSSSRYRTSSFVSIPVFHNNEIKAILNVTDKMDGQDFRQEEIRLLEFLAGQISKTITRFLMTEALVKTEQFKRELALASELQHNIIPRVFPEDGRVEIAARYLPAREMGGDLYDVFMADPDKLIMVMADVTGKGVPAAFYMSMVKSFIRGLALKYVSPLTMFRALNSFLLEHNQNTPRYVTVFLGVLHLKSGVMLYASSGHEPPLLHRQATGEIRELPAAGLMLGYLDELHCHEHRTTMQPGDTLLLFTDGLKDMRNKDNEDFGGERLKRLFGTVAALEVHQIIEEVTGVVELFKEGRESFDDLAVLGVRYRE